METKASLIIISLCLKIWLLESSVASLPEDAENNEDNDVCLRHELEERIRLKHHVGVLAQKLTTLESQMTQVIKGLQCTSGYTWHMPLNLCFRLSQEKQSWFNAEQICESEGGHLAKVNSTEIFEYLREQIKKNRHIPKIAYISIGGNDLKEEGTWKWVDDDLIDMNSSIWYYEIPGGRRENCLIMNSELAYRVVDTSCSLMHYYICQIG